MLAHSIRALPFWAGCAKALRLESLASAELAKLRTRRAGIIRWPRFSDSLCDSINENNAPPAGTVAGPRLADPSVKSPVRHSTQTFTGPSVKVLCLARQITALA